MRENHNEAPRDSDSSYQFYSTCIDNRIQNALIMYAERAFSFECRASSVPV